MAISLGTIYGDVRLRLGQLDEDAAKAKKTLGSVEQATNKTGDTAEHSGNAFTRFMGKVLPIAAGVGIVEAVSGAFGMLQGTLSDSIGKAKEMQDADSQLGAVLKSTGGVAGVTADHADRLAQSFSGMTDYSDESVKSAESMLLTFTNIGNKGGVFDSATQTVLDMSQALGQDTKSSAIQLGKALNDPIKGVTALQRVGVTFDEQQKKQIATMMKSGNIAGAQGVILKELSKEFGGSAKAAGDTFAGKLTIAQHAMDETKAKIGQALLPVLTKLLDGITPLITRFGDWLPGAMAKATTFINTTVIPAIGQIEDFIENKALPAVMKFGTWFQVNLLPILVKVGNMLIHGVGDAVKSAQKAFQDAQPQIKEMQTAFEKLKPVGEFLAKVIGSVIVIAIGIAIGAINGLLGAFRGIVEMMNGLMTFIRGAWDIISGIFTLNGDKISAGLTELWDGVKGMFKGAFDVITGFVRGFITGIVGWFQNLYDTLVGHSIIPDLVNGIVGFFRSMPDKVMGFVTGMIGDITGAFNGLVGKMGDIGKNIISGLINGIKGMAGNAVSTVENIGSNMLGGIKNFFGIHSPSSVMADLAEHGIMAGMLQGVQKGGQGVLGAMQAVSTGLTGAAMPVLARTGAGTSGMLGNGQGTTVNVYLTVDVQTDDADDQGAEQSGTQFGTAIGYGLASALQQRGY